MKHEADGQQRDSDTGYTSSQSLLHHKSIVTGILPVDADSAPVKDIHQIQWQPHHESFRGPRSQESWSRFVRALMVTLLGEKALKL